MDDIKLYAKSERDLDLSAAEHHSLYPGCHSKAQGVHPRGGAQRWANTSGSRKLVERNPWKRHGRTEPCLARTIAKMRTWRMSENATSGWKRLKDNTHHTHTSHGRTSAGSEHQSNGGIYHTRPSSSSRPLATYGYSSIYKNIDALHFLLLWKPCHPLWQTQQGSLQSN